MTHLGLFYEIALGNASDNLEICIRIADNSMGFYAEELKTIRDDIGDETPKPGNWMVSSICSDDNTYVMLLRFYCEMFCQNQTQRKQKMSHQGKHHQPNINPDVKLYGGKHRKS